MKLQTLPELDENIKPERLLSDLRGFMDIFHEAVVREKTDSPQLALVHLTPNLSLAEWQSLAARHKLDEWIAIPVDREKGLPLRQLRETLEQLAFHSEHDALTGLANKPLLQQKIRQECQRASQAHSDLSLVVIDLDNFSEVNRRHGYAMGDSVLVKLGEMLRSSIRIFDEAARCGGEKFCLILPDAESAQAADLPWRILSRFSAIPFPGSDGKDFFVSFSAGIASLHHDSSQSPQELVAVAESLLQKAKLQGKNRVLTDEDMQCPKPSSMTLVLAEEKMFLFAGKVTQ